MLHAVLLHRENVVDRLARPLAIVLIAGAALLGLGAAMHPVLSGNGAQDLQLIANTPHWRTIHLVMLAGSGLIVLGLWVRVVDRPELQGPAVAALAVIALGLAINALNIAYMAGSGTHLAEMFTAGRPGMSDLFEVTHPIGLMAARFGNFLVALGATALGVVEWNDPTRPRWLAWLAWGAALGGFVGVLFFDEASRVALAAVALLSAWEVATAARALAK
jgi:hypothetical protein